MRLSRPFPILWNEADVVVFAEEIRLHCRSRSFILYASSDELRREWIDDIRASITGTHKDELENKEAKKKVRTTLRSVRCYSDVFNLSCVE